MSSPIYEPVSEEPVLPDEADSPGLEWDEEGCELGHSNVIPQDSDADILQQIQNFENSIFRQDLDTGEMRCYQHNTRYGYCSKIFPITLSQNLFYRRVARRDQMTSILGHLEEDHKKLQVINCW